MQIVVFIALIALGQVAVESRRLPVDGRSLKHITRVSEPEKNGIDWCPKCVDTFDELIYFVIDGTIEVGIFTACNDLCDYVTQKSTNPYLPAICSVACDAVGVNEFIKLATEVDLDPIYFCESLQLCPINDNGDAKIVFFNLSPPHAEAGTNFSMRMSYLTMNGTGTSQLLITIQTIDYIKIAPFFLVEAKKPGVYEERFYLDTTPDPDCESAVYTCEQWLPGVYNVTIQLCNGECNSHRPHSKLYDMVKGSFQID